MNNQKQLGFMILESKSVKIFGGSALKKSNAKKARPISIKRSMHLVLRSSICKGPYSLLKKDQQVFSLIERQASKHGVKVYNYANGANQIHLVIKPISRRAFNNFVRSISGLIARLILGAERGCAILNGASLSISKFWDQRPFTRIIEWGRDFKNAISYVNQNTLEAYGFIEYKVRAKNLINST